MCIYIYPIYPKLSNCRYFCQMREHESPLNFHWNQKNHLWNLWIHYNHRNKIWITFKDPLKSPKKNHGKLRKNPSWFPDPGWGVPTALHIHLPSSTSPNPCDLVQIQPRLPWKIMVWRGKTPEQWLLNPSWLMIIGDYTWLYYPIYWGV